MSGRLSGLGVRRRGMRRGRDEFSRSWCRRCWEKQKRARLSAGDGVLFSMLGGRSRRRLGL